MAGKYLKPMLEAGASRVFNCNALTCKVLAKDPGARLFFNIVAQRGRAHKDASPGPPRAGSRGPPVGTKLYSPFNERDIRRRPANYEPVRRTFAAPQRF